MTSKKLTVTVSRKEQKFHQSPFEIRALASSDRKSKQVDYEFSGYALTFGNVDVYNDRIEPSVAEGFKTPLPMLWAHDPNEIIGKFDRHEADEYGVKVFGRLYGDVSRAKDAMALIERGDLTGMSIGFFTLESHTENDVRVLEKIDVVEVSLTPYPANTNARITSIDEDEENGQTQKERDSSALAEIAALIWDAANQKGVS